MKKFLSKENIDKIKSFFNKDITNQIKTHKIQVLFFGVLVSLTFIGLYVSYAYYQTTIKQKVIGSVTSRISDLDVRIMVEGRDNSGAAIGKYVLYDYIPQAGYIYNSEESYCSNGGIINYNSSTHSAVIDTDYHDICYLYFDSVAKLDLEVNVYLENVNSSGVGNGEYTLVTTKNITPSKYVLSSKRGTNNSGYTCSNNDTVIRYDQATNLFSMEALKRDNCSVWMDVLEADVEVTINVQESAESSEYIKVDKIPSNVTYVKSVGEHVSSCTNGATIDYQNDEVSITTTNKTKCVLFLDISNS